MKTKKRQFRIRYHESYLIGSHEKEGYVVEYKLPEDVEWSLGSFYECRRAEGDEEANYIHFSIINKINELLNLGFIMKT